MKGDRPDGTCHDISHYPFPPAQTPQTEAGSETRLVQTSVARVLGLNAALFLQQLNFRLRTPSHVVEGVAWYEASYASLQAVDFPFWCTKTIARTCRRLEKRGIITARPLSRNTYDRTKWYTINDAKLQEALGSTSGQSVPLEGTASPHDGVAGVIGSFFTVVEVAEIIILWPWL